MTDSSRVGYGQGKKSKLSGKSAVCDLQCSAVPGPSVEFWSLEVSSTLGGEFELPLLGFLCRQLDLGFGCQLCVISDAGFLGGGPALARAWARSNVIFR